MNVAGQDGPPEKAVSVILILYDYPAPDTGGGQRSLMFLDAIVALGPVHVVVLTGHVTDDAARHLPQAASIACWSQKTMRPGGIMRHVPQGALRLLAPSQSYRPDPVLRARLDDLIAQTGARIVMFRYFQTFAATGLSQRDGLTVLVDIDDRDDQKYATRLIRLFGLRLGGSWPLRFPLRNLARMMRGRLAAASLIWFSASEDVWTVPGVRTAILPNVPMTVPIQDSAPPSQGDSILFVGIYAHPPNRNGIRWFLDHCWADLSKQFPGIRLRIVGRGLPWPEMASHYTHLHRVDFVGPVEDLAAEYARARLCICPVHEGGGSKIKVVEAAAFGRPIVGVPHAFRGFDASIRDHAAEALSPKSFIAACADFLEDANGADRAGAALAEWQRLHYSRDAALAQIRADIASAINQHHQASLQGTGDRI